MVDEREDMSGVDSCGAPWTPSEEQSLRRRQAVASAKLARLSSGMPVVLRLPPAFGRYFPPATPTEIARQRKLDRDAVSGIPGYEHIAAMNGGALPFVDVPGKPLPKDGMRDKMIVEALKNAGVPTGKGAHLDQEQAGKLYATVRRYFDETDPLMNTERWMAGFVEGRGITYSDHDGTQYRMKGGVRKPLHPVAQKVEEDDDDDVADLDDFVSVKII